MSEITYNFNNPNGPINRALVNDNQALQVSLIGENGSIINQTPYEELLIAHKETVIELKSIYGLSAIRDKVTTSGSSSVTNINIHREYNVQVSGSSSSARLESTERGRYVAGKAAQYGLGIRLLNDTYSGDTVAKWGAINIDNGIYFGQDSTGKFVAVLDGGVETKIYQDSWNLDKCDGTGKSGEILDTTKGYVYNIDFTWYGYGVIDFVIYVKTVNGLRKVVIHRFIIDGKTSLESPNLPLTVEIIQTSNSTTESIFVGGRQFSILGSYTPTFRSTSDVVLNKSVSNAALIPLISLKQKSTHTAINANLSGFEILSTEDLIVEIYVGSTLTGGSFATPTRTSALETGYESNITATAFSGGTLIYRTLVGGGTGNKTSLNDINLSNLQLDIPEHQIITLVGQSLGGNSTVDAVLNIREEW